jgi:uncharacterized protein YjbI with pentapeptide repeats
MMTTATMKLEPIFTSREKRELTGEVFRSRELVDLDFSRADLRGACFEKTVLLRCSFAGADLRGARFLSCDLHGVDLAGAVLGDNRFDGTTLVDAFGLTAGARKIVADGGGTFQPGHASRR